MDATETVSTSAHTASTLPVVLRETDQVRLVFLPTLVDNAANPKAVIRGAFVYQRKGKNDEWESAATTSLATIKKGEAFKLDLHSAELLTLVEALGPLYRLVWQDGVPQGKKTFVRVEAGLARFLELNEPEFRAFLEAHSDQAATALNRLLQWLSLTPKLPAVLDKLASLPPMDVPPLSALLGLSTLKSASAFWKSNLTRTDEAFWQDALSDRSFVLSQLFGYPVLLLNDKAYLGGKSFENKGGTIADFLLQAVSTGALLVVEIKTPATPLVGSAYRKGVYPPSAELSGAVSQVLHYRQSLMKNFYALVAESGMSATLGEPHCVIVAGNAVADLESAAQRESFELYRHRMSGVTIVAFDELFARLDTSIALLEGGSTTKA